MNMDIHKIMSCPLHLSKRMTRMMENKTRTIGIVFIYFLFRTMCFGLHWKKFERKEPCVMKALKYSPSLSICQAHDGTTRMISHKFEARYLEKPDHFFIKRSMRCTWDYWYIFRKQIWLSQQILTFIDVTAVMV